VSGGVHLFVPMLHRHDAVGEHTRILRDRLVAAGLASRIYTELPDPVTSHETRPYLDSSPPSRSSPAGWRHGPSPWS